MKKTVYIIVLMALTILFPFCDGGKAKPEPLSSGYVGDINDYHNNIIEVPFKKLNGVRTIQVKINDCAEFPMIFDTGCSGMSISILELATLIKQGYISENDVIGISQAQIADGSVVEEAIVNLKKIQIGDYQCRNVRALISSNEDAPLLLGNGALKDVESFKVDDDAQIIQFYLK